ncbi:hypothetical protein KBC03_01705 [Patescibacteria group bacterium]|nr:hypothetical protein [Patescibacteria group bacterium]
MRIICGLRKNNNAGLIVMNKSYIIDLANLMANKFIKLVDASGVTMYGIVKAITHFEATDAERLPPWLQHDRIKDVIKTEKCAAMEIVIIPIYDDCKSFKACYRTSADTEGYFTSIIDPSDQQFKVKIYPSSKSEIESKIAVKQRDKLQAAAGKYFTEVEGINQDAEKMINNSLEQLVDD